MSKWIKKRFDELALYPFADKAFNARNYIGYMLNRTQSMFKYDGLPDTITKRDLEMLLQINGFACFADVKGDLYAFYGGLGGEPNAYYRPTICTVANPALKYNKNLVIDKDCVIVSNDALRIGMMPLFNRYASAMAENDLTMRMQNINTRIPALISAPDDRTKESAEKYISDVEKGKLSIIASSDLFDGIRTSPYTAQGSTSKMSDLIEYHQYLKASWYNDIGLNSNYNMKRESIMAEEAKMNDDALLPLVDNMLEERQIGLEKVNAMFGTNISVSLASSWEDQQEINDMPLQEETQETGEEETENAETVE